MQKIESLCKIAGMEYLQVAGAWDPQSARSYLDNNVSFTWGLLIRFIGLNLAYFIYTKRQLKEWLVGKY